MERPLNCLCNIISLIDRETSRKPSFVPGDSNRLLYKRLTICNIRSTTDGKQVGENQILKLLCVRSF